MSHSILDNDLYKFTTSYAYMAKYPHAAGKFTFIDRNRTVLTNEDLQSIKGAMFLLGERTLSAEEINWCKLNIPFIPGYYWEWLGTFRFDPDIIKVELDEESHLHIEVEDILYKVTLYEVPILAMVSMCLCGNKQFDVLDMRMLVDDLREKIAFADAHGLRFSEFGTRRRFSYEVQDEVCRILASEGAGCCVGTSNVHFAKEYGMRPMGTHPHEWFMFHGAQFGYKHANYMALEAWQEIYQGDLGIALTDTYTSKVFFRNFTKKHAKLFDGIRHDSGSPYAFTNRAIARYRELDIDPMTKTVIYSDGLNLEKAAEIAKYCDGKINCSFGIGTNLTNDIPGVKPCNIVMKLSSCRMTYRQPDYETIKLSDVPGKTMGPEDEIRIACHELGLHDGEQL